MFETKNPSPKPAEAPASLATGQAPAKDAGTPHPPIAGRTGLRGQKEKRGREALRPNPSRSAQADHPRLAPSAQADLSLLALSAQADLSPLAPSAQVAASPGLAESSPRSPYPDASGTRPGHEFLDLLRQFNEQGQPSLEVVETGLHYVVNAFWTAGQRRGHSLHEISYRACFKPQLPGFFIERLTRPGDRVYDPFSGRGTTPVEAALLGRAPAANDINPLSAMMTEPRLAPPSIQAIADRLEALDLSAGVPDPVENDLLAFYHPDTLRQLTALRNRLLDQTALDPVDGWIRMVALNRLTGHSPGFFSVYTMPPNQAVSAVSQRKINEKRNQEPPVRDVKTIILKKSKGLLADGVPPPHPAAVLMTGLSDEAAALPDGSVDLVVTSPPFLDVVDYEGDNWLRCWFAGIDPASVNIARHRDTAAWEVFVRRTFRSLARVVRPGGFVAFEVGEVRGGRILLERNVVAAIDGLPFDVLGVMVNQQEFTKTANCWGVGNNTHGTNTNRIVLAIRR